MSSSHCDCLMGCFEPLTVNTGKLISCEIREVALKAGSTFDTFTANASQVFLKYPSSQAVTIRTGLAAEIH